MKKASRFLLTALTCATMLSAGFTADAVGMNQNINGSGEISSHTVTRGLTDNRLGDFNSAYRTDYNVPKTMSRDYNPTHSRTQSRDIGSTGVARHNNLKRANIPSVADNYNTPNNLGTAINTDNNIIGMHRSAANRHTTSRDMNNGLRHPSPYYRNGELGNMNEAHVAKDTDAAKVTASRSATRATVQPTTSRATVQPATSRDTARSTPAKAIATKAKTAINSAATRVNEASSNIARATESNANHSTAIHQGRAVHTHTRDNHMRNNYNLRDREHGVRATTHRAASRFNTRNGYTGNYRAYPDGYAHGTSGFRTRATDRNSYDRNHENIATHTPRVTVPRTAATRAVAHRTTTPAQSRTATITFIILLVAIASLLALAIYALMRPRHDKFYASDNDSASRRR